MQVLQHITGATCRRDDAGLIKFSCDDKGNSKCICESAGLASCFPGAVPGRARDVCVCRALIPVGGGMRSNNMPQPAPDAPPAFPYTRLCPCRHPAGAAAVATPTGPKRLADLQLGEAVLAMDPATGALAFSPVHMWSSRRPGQAAQVLKVHTDAGLNLTGGLSRAGSWEAGWYCEWGWSGFALRCGCISACSTVVRTAAGTMLPRPPPVFLHSSYLPLLLPCPAIPAPASLSHPLAPCCCSHARPLLVRMAR